MSRVYQYDNRVDVTYVYDVEEIFDEKTGKTRSKRKLIGKLNPETKQLVPTGKRGRPAKTDSPSADTKKEETRNKEELAKARFLETLQKKDEAIAALKSENRQLKAVINKLEKTLLSISTLCGDIQYTSNQDFTD
ncbi:MAG: hypothetical protein IKF59_06095 [Lachnospiraceae bacterium]|nr:hypothetical protein [Blautia sp.]MBR3187589.1 hypothetical protein [Lachnospiraceae bacterium]